MCRAAWVVSPPRCRRKAISWHSIDAKPVSNWHAPAAAALRRGARRRVAQQCLLAPGRTTGICAARTHALGCSAGAGGGCPEDRLRPACCRSQALLLSSRISTSSSRPCATRLWTDSYVSGSRGRAACRAARRQQRLLRRQPTMEASGSSSMCSSRIANRLSKRAASRPHLWRRSMRME